MQVGSLFAGIGGLELGLERAGMEIVWQVEVDEWCRRVLARHFPDAVRYGDVRECHGGHVADARSPGGRRGAGANGSGQEATPRNTQTLAPVDLICGGFPCQPVSHAGKRLGDKDERWLWPEMARIIREVRPGWVVVENTPGLRTTDTGRLGRLIIGELATFGYRVEWESLPAAAFGAPHLRDRIFIVAHAQRTERWQNTAGGDDADGHDAGRDQAAGRSTSGSDALAYAAELQLRQEPQAGHYEAGHRRAEDVPDADEPGQGQRCAEPRRWPQPIGESSWWSVEPDVGRVAHGVAFRVNRLKCCGNGVVAQQSLPAWNEIKRLSGINNAL